MQHQTWDSRSISVASLVTLIIFLFFFYFHCKWLFIGNANSKKKKKDDDDKKDDANNKKAKLSSVGPLPLGESFFFSLSLVSFMSACFRFLGFHSLDKWLCMAYFNANWVQILKRYFGPPRSNRQIHDREVFIFHSVTQFGRVETKLKTLPLGFVWRPS